MGIGAPLSCVRVMENACDASCKNIPFTFRLRNTWYVIFEGFNSMTFKNR
jgi:hypothetical protein